MASPVSNLSLATNLYAKALAEREAMPMVYSADFGYNVIQQVIGVLNKNKSVSVAQPKFEIPKMGNISIAAQLGGNPVLVGTNLRITFAQANSNFRIKDIVLDSNLVQGRVVNIVSPTQVDLEPVSVTSWNTATHFQSGAYAKVGFDASGNFSSRGKSTLTYTPEYDFNYTAVSRETSSQARRDRMKTYIRWNGEFWWHSYQKLTMMAFAKQQEFKYFYSERGTHTSAVEGEYFTTGGIRWNVINNNGSYFPISNQLTRSSFADIIYDYSMKTAKSGQKIIGLMGKQAMINIQTNMTSDFIQYGGNTNTFGGMSVSGLNVMKYAVGGVEIDFVHYPLFDDPILFPEISTITGQPKNSSSIFLLDASPVEAVDGSGTIPPLQRYYFGDSEYLHKYIPGMVGIDGTRSSTVVQGGDMQMTASDVDGAQFEILCDDGLYVIPERLGLIELAS